MRRLAVVFLAAAMVGTLVAIGAALRGETRNTQVNPPSVTETQLPQPQSLTTPVQPKPAQTWQPSSAVQCEDLTGAQTEPFSFKGPTSNSVLTLTLSKGWQGRMDSGELNARNLFCTFNYGLERHPLFKVYEPADESNYDISGGRDCGPGVASSTDKEKVQIGGVPATKFTMSCKTLPDMHVWHINDGDKRIILKGQDDSALDSILARAKWSQATN